MLLREGPEAAAPESVDSQAVDRSFTTSGAGELVSILTGSTMATMEGAVKDRNMITCTSTNLSVCFKDGIDSSNIKDASQEGAVSNIAAANSTASNIDIKEDDDEEQEVVQEWKQDALDEVIQEWKQGTLPSSRDTPSLSLSSPLALPPGQFQRLEQQSNQQLINTSTITSSVVAEKYTDPMAIKHYKGGPHDHPSEEQRRRAVEHYRKSIEKQRQVRQIQEIKVPGSLTLQDVEDGRSLELEQELERQRQRQQQNWCLCFWCAVLIVMISLILAFGSESGAITVFFALIIMGSVLGVVRAI
jgi:hypothetical protein